MLILLASIYVIGRYTIIDDDNAITHFLRFNFLNNIYYCYSTIYCVVDDLKDSTNNIGPREDA